MKYIIMCGGIYNNWHSIRQLIKINGEEIVARTIRLLKENGIEDISISSNVDNVFDKFGVPVLKHTNSYIETDAGKVLGCWADAFYPFEEPACYLFGDVVFSDDAIKKIIATKTNDIEFFASAPPFASNYPKKYAEPFALKVVNQKHLRDSVERLKLLDSQHAFKRIPIMWELWQVIKNTPLNKIDYHNYTAINDYTCDIDYESEVKIFENILLEKKTKYLIHAMPKRMLYVEKFLIPSMTSQGINISDISVYNDIDHLGNLKACMNAFKTVPDDSSGTWHLQDDVIISHDFKEKTELYDDGIVCGFYSRYDGDNPCGYVPYTKMWFSFPCIRIPNQIARGCADWCLTYMINNPVYREYWEKGVNDDWMFRYYVKDYHKDEKILNLAPNIVDHIDYLIGGTVNSNSRKLTQIRSRYWQDEALVEELKWRLKDGMDHD